MNKIQLKAENRELKTNVNGLRKAGLLPAVLYGHNVKNQHLTLNLGEFEKAFRKAGESTIIELETSDGQTHPVLIHDVQLHFLTSAPIHADFYQVSMTEKLKAKVVLEFFGESKAVKELGGVLVKVLSEVEVECLPADLPHNIPVDISRLNVIADIIHISDLKINPKVKILLGQDEIVAKVQPPRDIEAELAPAVADEKAVVEATVAASEKPKAEEEGKEPAADEKGKAKDEKPKKE